MKSVIGMTISEEVLDELDARRGLINRSIMVEEILRKELGLPTIAHNRKPTARQLSTTP